MLSSLLIALTPSIAPLLPRDLDPTDARTLSLTTSGALLDFKEQYKAAGKDPVKLWALYEWALESEERKKYRKRILKALIKADPGHQEARKVLGHTEFEGEWFESDRALDRHMERIAVERGLTKLGSEWVPSVDVRFLLLGLEKDEYGDWVDPVAIKRLADGWKQQDLIWVEPGDFARLDEGLWKCGDEWKDLAAANTWHGDYDSPWMIPTKRANVWATTSRETAMLAAKQAELAWFDMQKVFGYESGLPVSFMVMKTQADFLRFMDGDAAYQIPRHDPLGVSSYSRASFAEFWFDTKTGQYNGMGVTYWDATDPNGAVYGIHDARFAYGLSYVEGLDSAADAVAKALAEADGEEVDPGPFMEERLNTQRIPTWFRWGAANYASRWFKDPTITKGGDPLWAFNWSVGNLKSQGGLPDLNAIFEFNVGIESESSSTLILSAGLLVAYIVDGGNADMSRLLKELQQGLQKGQDVEKVFEDIRKKLDESEEQIRAFAGL